MTFPYLQAVTSPSDPGVDSDGLDDDRTVCGPLPGRPLLQLPNVRVITSYLEPVAHLLKAIKYEPFSKAMLHKQFNKS